MKRIFITVLLTIAIVGALFAQGNSKVSQSNKTEDYIPTPENLAARKQFEGFRFGVFLHWGIYSTFAQGEWYLNAGIQQDEYAKAASAFYPARYDAKAWVKAIKGSGAKYITFTSRHHDSFSMFKTQESTYNIVDATPFKRDVLKELSDACHEQDIQLHIYYSILDWARKDYPVGSTGLNTGRELKPNYDTYFNVSSTNLKQRKLRICCSLHIDAWLLWKQAICSKCS